ncbi:tryptophan--tRNA ligase [Gryllotalpicola ginsengisoli]|uniref:tryptophan--tRNA ligase n=1 Tax=Gryllotalpicola ginsengisoli TaxID=444608 RepID=UPI0003B707AC|nr:tryptophan--tRNA ligase [Gryllotalpicola ginsengisoli]
MSKPRLFSGIQPSSDSLHLGNYLGALVQWRAMQNDYDAFFCIVDLHALTNAAHDPKSLPAATRGLAAQYLACGIEPGKSTLYVQSHVPAHTELTWILNTITGFGEASRMTQFKDKSQRFGTENQTVGLFDYPVLMAADILLYQADVVPVGDDQTQHVELTRNLAERFNSRFGEVFTVPKLQTPEEGARIYDLQEPTSKMSKSAASDAGLIWLLDEPSVTRKKIMRAVTDTGSEVRFDRGEKPGVSNLLEIYTAITGQTVAAAEAEFAGRGYGDFKRAVADAVVAELEPVRTRTLELLDDPAELDRLLAVGAEHAAEVAAGTLKAVYDAVGLLPRR